MNHVLSTTVGKSGEGINAGVEYVALATMSLVGVALVVVSLGNASFRDAHGSLTTAAAFPLGAGAGLLLSAGAARIIGLRTAFWTALLVAAEAAVLQLVTAGPFVRYQHLRPLSEWFDPDVRIATLIIVLQAILVLLQWRRVLAIGRTLTAAVMPVAPLLWIGVGGLIVFTSAALSREISHYAFELASATATQVLSLATLALALDAVPSVLSGRVTGFVERVFSGTSGRRHAWADPVALVAAAWVVLAAVALNWWSYERHPHVPDEVSYLFQSRYLAEGRLWLPVPPVPEAFDVNLMFTAGDRWFSPMPPGWPMVLALGTFVSAPWLINPLLGGLNLLLLFALTHRLWDHRTARLVALLTAASPWFVFLAMSFMNHQVTLTGALLVVLCVQRALHQSAGRTWPVLAGMAAGFVALVRPLDGVAVAGIAGVWMLAGSGLRRGIAPLAAFAVGAVVPGVAMLLYNHQITGSALTAPLTTWSDAIYGPHTNALGFGPDRGWGWTGLDPYPGHSVLDAVINAALNASSVNVELFGWGTGSMCLIGLFALTRGKRAHDWATAAAGVWVVALYSLYWFSGGPDFGARYWFLIFPSCVILAARAFELACRRLPPTWRLRVRLGVLSLCMATLVVFVPWRAIDKYHHYRGMRPDIRELAKRYGFSRDLVLIRGERHPDYVSAFIYNPVDLRAGASVYAWNIGPEARDKVVRSFPNRRVWLVDGPSRTRSGFEVVAGPLADLEAVRAAEEQAAAQIRRPR